MPKAERHVSKTEGAAITPRGKTARERRRQHHIRAKQRNSLFVFLMVAGAVAFVYLMIRQVEQPFDPGVLAVAPARPHPQALDNRLGSPEASVILTEYSDFACSACQSFWAQIEPIILDDYVATGKIQFEYRSASDFLGPASARAAEAAYCAGDQEKFWEMHDAIFANFAFHTTPGYTDDLLTALGEQIGLEPDAFAQCFEGGAMRQRVAQDRLDFEAVNQDLIGASQSYGTPTLAINGVRVDIVSDWTELFNALDAAIAAAGD